VHVFERIFILVSGHRKDPREKARKVAANFVDDALERVTKSVGPHAVGNQMDRLIPRIFRKYASGNRLAILGRPAAGLLVLRVRRREKVCKLEECPGRRVLSFSRTGKDELGDKLRTLS
jgi:hypothetical protein